MNTIRQSGIAPLIVIIFLGLVTGVAILFTSLQRSQQKSSVNENNQTTTATETVTQATPSPPSVSKISPSLKPTPTPIQAGDISLTPGYSKISRSYDKGDGQGAIVDKTFYYGAYAIFDEISPYWGSVMQICLELKTSQNLQGKNLDVDVTVDGLRQGRTTLSYLDSLSANSKVEFCRDSSASVGRHNVTIEVNRDKRIVESNYSNNSFSLNYEISPDNMPPSFTIYGPVKEIEGTCLWPQEISDNISPYSDMNIQINFDNNQLTTFNGSRSCIAGSPGETHTYYVKITDKRGNTTEKNKNFSIL